jgi:acyl carrier protein
MSNFGRVVAETPSAPRPRERLKLVIEELSPSVRAAARFGEGEEIGLSSLQVIELIMKLEEEFAIEFDPADLDEDSFRTFDDIVTLVEQKYLNQSAGK